LTANISYNLENLDILDMLDAQFEFIMFADRLFFFMLDPLSSVFAIKLSAFIE
jgi:hypothetical protein